MTTYLYLDHQRQIIAIAYQPNPDVARNYAGTLVVASGGPARMFALVETFPARCPEDTLNDCIDRGLHEANDAASEAT